MKRTITELEQKIIDKGFKLHHKTYSGKHSQFVSTYCYVAELPLEEKIKVHLTLNAKRDNILGFTFDNPLPYNSFSKDDVKYINDILDSIDRYIYE